MLKGIPASPGIAIGKAFVYEKELKVERREIDETEIEKELERFNEAVKKSKEQLVRIKEKVAGEIGEKEANIFQAHLLMSEDPTLIEEVTNMIKSRKSVEVAVQEAVKKFVSMFKSMKGEYMKERSADIQDVGERILRNLLGREQASLADLEEEVIVIARTLMPSDTAYMNKKKVLGFATDSGGMMSHVAIIARECRIPAIVGCCDITKKVLPGYLLIIDGCNGVVVVNPDEKTLNQYRKAKEELEERQKELEKIEHLPAETLDGRRIELAANIGNPGEADQALLYGAEGVGLFRTEFLYLDRDSPPTEEEQFEVYKTVAEKMGKRPVMIRTLDIGGDKPLSYIEMPKETNPFLGWRAIRIFLDQPDIFKTQLRAILRASVYGNLKIMYPMISSLEEVRKANKILNEVKKELISENIPFKDIEVGIMIETPSAALIADLLAKDVDFFSIGTNDLTQYTLAVDRTNEKVAYLYDPLHPAVLRLIKKVILAAHTEGKWVGMCGEMAGDPRAILILLGLDLDEFSMNPASIPEVKKIVKSTSYAKAKETSNKALSLSTADEVRKFAEEVLASKG